MNRYELKIETYFPLNILRIFRRYQNKKKKKKGNDKVD